MGIPLAKGLGQGPYPHLERQVLGTWHASNLDVNGESET